MRRLFVVAKVDLLSPIHLGDAMGRDLFDSVQYEEANLDHAELGGRKRGMWIFFVC